MKIPIVYQSAEEALAVVKPGYRIYVHGSAQTPTLLLKGLESHAHRLKDVELVFITVYGDVHVDKPQYEGIFHINSMFVSASIRKTVAEGRADYIPVFLSEIPELFKQNILPLDVAMVQVSPPDEHGYCSLGVSVDIARSAVNTARHIIALVNPNVPRTHGDGLIHSIRFDSMVYTEEPLFETRFGDKLTDLEMKIGALVASLIEDRSTLQMGIGCIPDAVLRLLTNHKDLGIHTEMCSDGIIDLVEKDVINNKYKQIHPNKTVTAFALGTKRLYNYVNDNPAFQFLDIDYVNDPHI
ncbi:MAG TPA: 4-hydroxybutyrate CoA-transferase, partial [Chitinophagaceae bacterium]|nr:4-hydroxybutyrate CoA-transferase [Chitinophagaceae bacterium]